MTPQQFRSARLALGLTPAEMAAAIGMSLTAVKHMEMTNVHRTTWRAVPEPVAKLVRAYLDGYKPEERK
jgi:hypothetical protein